MLVNGKDPLVNGADMSANLEVICLLTNIGTLRKTQIREEVRMTISLT